MMQPPPSTSLLVVGGLLAAEAILNTFSPRWPYEPWVKLVFRLFAFSLLASIAFTLVLSFYALPWPRYWVFYTLKSVFLGVAAGMIALFFLSDEAYRGIRRSREMKESEKTSPSNEK